MNELLESNGKKYFRIIIAFIFFLVISFVNFSVTILFLSHHIVYVTLYNLLLNLIPIYLLWKILLKNIGSKKINNYYWISTILLSIILVWPYGEYVIHFFFKFLIKLA